MKIDIQFIDSNGFIHFEKGKSKKAVLNFCKRLHPNTEIRWSKKSVFISQQYVNRKSLKEV